MEFLDTRETEVMIGRRSSVVGRRSSVVGRRSSVVGRRSSVVGRRSSVVGRRSSGAGWVLALIVAVVFAGFAEREAMAQCPPSSDPEIRYVKIGGTGSFGLCWDDAYGTLEEALADANNSSLGITTIRVAQGTYRPLAQSGFVILAAVTIEGGYRGFTDSEGDADDRDLCEFPTVLSGDLLGDDDGTLANMVDNAIHVLRVSSLSGVTPGVLDGLHVTAGCALNAESASDRIGGGLRLDETGEETVVRVQSCRFYGNVANLGGAIGSRMRMICRDSLFEENSALPTTPPSGPGTTNGAGGAIFGTTTFDVVHCRFDGNEADGTGGAIVISRGTALVEEGLEEPPPAGTEGPDGYPFWVTSSVFVGNQCSFTGPWRGGAIGVQYQAMLLATNCVFQGNTAPYGGAIGVTSTLPLLEAQVVLTNCTLTGNFGGSSNGGVDSPTAQIANSILFGNGTLGDPECGSWETDEGIEVFDPDLCAQIGGVDPVNFHISHSCVAGISWAASFWTTSFGPGNIDLDPQFVDPASGDLRLAPGSAAIEAGDNLDIPADVTDVNDNADMAEQLPWDIRRFVRVFGCDQVVDMGAYEWGGCTGDATGDGSVDGADIALLLGNWGSCQSAPCAGDLDCDGEVAGSDMALVLGNWGPCPPLPSAPCFWPLSAQSEAMSLKVGAGATPASLMELLGMSGVEQLVGWLSSLESSTMKVILEAWFGL
ncbi:MAG: hypothetical protein KF724_00260 [Phycisphaeraceae bacterium]|nr:hypothetical protein [Phycisphaeraceae bacterium]